MGSNPGDRRGARLRLHHQGEGSRSGLFGPNAIGDESFRKMLEQVFGDPSVRAVVIRVNSGGGSATASDFMWHALLEMKKKHDKPVVFSFGNIAASGAITSPVPAIKYSAAAARLPARSES